MTGAHRDTTIAARVPLDLRADLERVVELEQRAGKTRPDGQPIDLSTILRKAARQYADRTILGTDGELGGLRAATATGGLFARTDGPTFARTDGPTGAARPSDPATSKAAARDVAPRLGSQRRRALEVIVRAGERGATADEVIAYLEQTSPSRRVAVNGVARRVTDLLQADAIRELTTPNPDGPRFDVVDGKPTITAPAPPPLVVTRKTRNGSAATVYVATRKGRDWLNTNRPQETTP